MSVIARLNLMCRKGLRVLSPVDLNFASAFRARPDVGGPVVRRSALLLKYRFVPFVVALHAKPMRWFFAVGTWLGDVGERSGSDGLKAVCSFARVPFFHAGKFCFKRANAFQHRVFTDLCRESSIISGHDYGQEFSGFGINKPLVSNPDHRGGNFSGGLQRANDGSDLPNIDHLGSPSANPQLATNSEGESTR